MYLNRYLICGIRALQMLEFYLKNAIFAQSLHNADILCNINFVDCASVFYSGTAFIKLEMFIPLKYIRH